MNAAVSLSPEDSVAAQFAAHNAQDLDAFCAIYTIAGGKIARVDFVK